METKKYIICPNEWDYEDAYSSIATYVDKSANFRITVFVDRDRFNNISSVKILGESLGTIDYYNCYYYDLSQKDYANRAWSNTYMTAEDFFGYDNNIEVNVEVPQWFVEHMRTLKMRERKCSEIFKDALSDNVGNRVSISKIHDCVCSYINDNCSDFESWYNNNTDATLAYDVVDNAMRSGQIVSCGNGTYMINN